MADRRMGVGFIGCGGHCRGANIPCAAANPRLKLTAFCDLRREPLEELKAEYRPKFITDDMERVFADPDVGMVICATKPDVRLPVMELAVRHRKPLFVEKPLAYTAEDVLKAVELMRDSGVPLIVGFNRPYSPMMQAIRPIFERQRQGTALISYRIVGEGFLWPPEHRRAVYERRESTVIHETTHIFDLLNWLTRSAPTKIYMAGAGHVDNLITLTYPRDTFATIMAGDNGTVGYPKERLDINTHYGTIIGDFFTELWAVRCGPDSGRRTFPATIGGKSRRLNGRRYALEVGRWREGVTEEQRATGHYFGHYPDVNKGHAAQLEYFRRQIVDGAPVETDVVRGALATLIGWKAIDSWQQGKALDLDFEFLGKKELERKRGVF